MQQLLDQPPHTVARQLVGKTLEINGRQATITKVKPQTATDNANWVDSRPLFGSKPVAAYVAPYRGNHMLFLRTGAKNTCVRIDAVETEDETYVNPGQVCQAFELSEEASGSVKLRGNTIVVEV